MNVTKETSERELLDAIKKMLKKSGHLDKIQAEPNGIHYWTKVSHKEFYSDRFCATCIQVVATLEPYRPIVCRFYEQRARPTDTHRTRAKVTELLRERQEGGGGAAPAPTPEVLLVNELVREYLEWNGYLYTASVLAMEAALPAARRARGELCAAVGVRDDDRSLALPLLANVVAAYVERIRRKLSRGKRDA